MVETIEYEAYIGKSSHPFGTLKQMNALQAADIAARISSPAIFEGYSAHVVTKDFNGRISAMRCLGGGATDLVCQGAYSLKTPSYRFLFVLHSMTTLAEGTYFILERGEDDVGLPCLICGQKFSVIDKDGVKAMKIMK